LFDQNLEICGIREVQLIDSTSVLSLSLYSQHFPCTYASLSQLTFTLFCCSERLQHLGTVFLPSFRRTLGTPGTPTRASTRQRVQLAAPEDPYLPYGTGTAGAGPWRVLGRFAAVALHLHRPSGLLERLEGTPVVLALIFLLFFLFLFMSHFLYVL